MTKCPKCGENIDYVIVYSYEQNKRAVSLDEKGSLDWGCSTPLDSSSTKDEVECPACYETIFVTDGSYGEMERRLIPLLKGEQ